MAKYDARRPAPNGVVCRRRSGLIPSAADRAAYELGGPLLHRVPLRLGEAEVVSLVAVMTTLASDAHFLLDF